ncbi:chalcone--flavonone isomerase-like protein [Carex littledalei]|uniref:Chalcone-flavonone isomerase family protein n=1 Tax=Carex littledalei TaxID=544730 RepID=A0A833RH94_9POAL|nr:chalcone--flavonone isomerase-like protein [Carex littledalei]
MQIAFSEGDSVPEQCDTVIKNKALCLAVFDSIIGKHSVSPAAKCSLAVRLAQLLNQSLS